MLPPEAMDAQRIVNHRGTPVDQPTPGIPGVANFSSILTSIAYKSGIEDRRGLTAGLWLELHTPCCPAKLKVSYPLG